jgi:hypothetical protein
MTTHLVKTPMPRAVTCLLVLLSLLAVGAKPNATGSAKAARAAKRAGQQQPIKLPAAVLEEPTGPVMEVAAIDRSRRPQVAEAAGEIDRLLAKHWKEQSGLRQHAPQRRPVRPPHLPGTGRADSDVRRDDAVSRLERRRPSGPI